MLVIRLETAADQDVFLSHRGNAPINVNPVGGGSADKGWGFDQEVKILVNCPRVGKHTFTKCS